MMIKMMNFQMMMMTIIGRCRNQEGEEITGRNICALKIVCLRNACKEYYLYDLVLVYGIPRFSDQTQGLVIEYTEHL
jgi:hypothetical protein